SYTEFSYMILQAYDFLHLHRTMDCTVQLAGSDQYGNILSGIDLIRREAGSGGEHPAFGITAPLVTHADGRKIGKTERGAVWLTADRTSPYAFYQYWINVDDAEVDQFLRWFTLLEREAIEETITRHVAAPHERCGQRRLAEEMTRLIHGNDELQRAERATTALFGGGDVRELDAGLLDQVVPELPASDHAVGDLSGAGVALVELLPRTSLAQSKREAREFLGNNAVSVNGERAEPDRTLTSADLLPGRTILLRRGKRKWHATRWA
ncbi:MAG: tyrosine--tRNA ligase, partial [Phycisphaerae bacterium]|nr:tyrosine--tRNA ligase [Phycisphaerae bacterium]